MRALREAGAQVAITSATTDGAALFALKRLAGPGGAAQAVDLTNPTNIRVATRKLAKQLGGLDVAWSWPARRAGPPCSTSPPASCVAPIGPA